MQKLTIFFIFILGALSSCNIAALTKEDCFSSGSGFCAFCQLNQTNSTGTENSSKSTKVFGVENSSRSFCFEIDICNYDFFTQCHNSFLEGELFYKADFTNKELKSRVHKCDAKHRRDDIVMIVFIIIGFCMAFCMILVFLKKADYNLQKQLYVQIDG